PIASFGIYYVDDICLYEIPADTINQDLLSDTTNCSSITLIGSASYNQFGWYDSGNTLVSTNQNYTATTTDTYILYSSDSTVCPKTFYRDTIGVVISSSVLNTFANVAICPVDSIFLQGAYQDTAGIYYDTLTSALGCDSIVETTLTIIAFPTSTLSVSICQGDSILLGGSYQTTTGVYNDTIIGGGSSGCDSLTVTTLTIDAPPIILLSSTGSYCLGDSLLIDAGNPGANYLWSPNGETSQSIYADSAGNYSVLVTNTNGCSDSATIVVAEMTVPEVIISGDTSACIGDTAVLISTNGTVIWNTGDTSTLTSVMPTNSGWYSATLSNSCGSSMDSIYVEVNPLPIASAGNDTMVMPQEEFILNAAGGVSYLWSPTNGLSCITCPNPTASMEANTIYCVTVSDSNGCVSNDCVSITIDSSGEVWAPNIFSPNNDALNDVFYIRGSIQPDNFVLLIFNRWGEKVFETTDPTQGWDGAQNGKELNTAVFVYKTSGITWGGTEFTLHGNITRLTKY
ncbi:MAG TPA: gliding motility-associated C-terminal domain-containing protein, partial [Flavobacteriales bacterium]|nr:gliding motility-associated C-terminal domain-containing protein [Flavobacteriales bacterium]